MILFLSGPMSGYQDYNFPAFYAAADQLRARGHSVVHLADIFRLNTNYPRPVFIRAALRALMDQAEALVALPDWHTSDGAMLEIHVATALGLPVYNLADLL